MDISAYLIAFVSFILSLEKVSGLECYACTNQDSNKDKCIKTTMQCDEGKDACLTWVRWGIPPYWTPHGDRIYFISKGCSTINQCGNLQKNTMSFCKRDWYADWGCYECCAGDLCNYYVTLDGNRVQYHIPVLMASLTTALLYTWRMTS